MLTIIGCGNPNRRDDGVGVEVAKVEVEVAVEVAEVIVHGHTVTSATRRSHPKGFECALSLHHAWPDAMGLTKGVAAELATKG